MRIGKLHLEEKIEFLLSLVVFGNWFIPALIGSPDMEQHISTACNVRQSIRVRGYKYC
jgi:hypothetical protein